MTASPSAAHPRSRGENEEALRPRTFAGGSSPLTRGKHHRRSAPNGIKNGSSPLTRGKRDHAERARDVSRLIPAHAGKTNPPLGQARPGGAHPRSRGENTVRDLGPPLKGGSSPLTRGKLAVDRRDRDSGGLIPAHAGKTVVGCVAAAFGGAHPRSRGENGLLGQLDNLGQGSSPLTRGKRPRYADQAVRPRLIPAHAGKTAAVRRRPGRVRAHPRSRGENSCLLSAA